ncbi:CvpA family protein [Desulfotomaculum copahuensis]|uniref:Colicin V production protein n=1 Tax=Desulfotomaculum copahuensis TaxID=1838280 RepID=A0A1B7LB69_9FIRM|nr:CvpA family protein [Desulfotomaculum copahuensis]OAT79471.1 hypothetical protein A6M21_15825 [Desulfotomaculum copahuensis]
MNWLDVLILLVVVWSAWRGLHTGLVAGVAGLLALFLGLAAAFHYYPLLAVLADQHWHLTARVNAWLPALPGLSHYPAPAVAPGVQTQLAGLKSSLAAKIVELAAFVCIFLIVNALVHMVGDAAARAARMSFIGPFDRAGGLALGVLRGLILVLVVLALLMPLQKAAAALPGGAQQSWFIQGVHNSRLAMPLWQALRRLPVTRVPLITYL